MSYCLFYSLLLSVLFYPTVGTPFADFHSLLFSLIGIFLLILAIKTKKNVYWFLLPIILTLGFLSKQVPTSYISFIIIIFSFYYLVLNFNKMIVISVVVSLFTILLLVLSFSKIYNIDYKDFINQYILFSSTIGRERLAAGFLFPIEFKRFFLRFKLIHLSQIILIITLIKNIHLNINFIKKDDFIILLHYFH